MMSTLGIAAVSGAAVFVGHHLLTKPPPFHIDVEQPDMSVAGINMFPVLRKIFSLLPDSTRQNAITKMSAPFKIPRDRFDLTGETPYTVSEVVQNTLWKVTFDQEFVTLTDPEERHKFFSNTGMDPKKDSCHTKVLEGAKCHGADFVEIIRKDLSTYRELSVKLEKDPTDLTDVPYYRLNMFVYKMPNGGLLLYAPVRIREEFGFGEWLDGLGKVEWIIVGANSHTLYIRLALERYPEAKVVGPELAEKKLKLVMGALPHGGFDYLSTKADSVEAANKLLSDQNVELFPIVGDVALNAMVVRVGESVLSCDVMYGHHDGEGHLMHNKEEFSERDPKNWFDRIYKCGILNQPNSRDGFLPNYRYWSMDLNSMGVMLHDPPARDGSDCKKMANSLRKVLKAEFKSGHGVHNSDMSRDDFCKTVDKCWNWLDGKTLLHE